jgi:septal ring factor EnvC (AmiA/AmiB activator)
MRYLRYIICIVFASCTLVAQAQTIEELREELQQYEKEKADITALQSATLKDRQATETDLKLTLAKKTNTQKIVNTLDRQIGVLENDINISNSSIRSMSVRQDKLKAEYARMVRSAYRNYKMNNFLVFLFAAEDFNDATRRVDLMRRYNSYREKTAGELKQVSDSIAVRKTALDGQRAELETTKGSRTKEVTLLGQEERQYRVAADELKKRQSTLSKQLAEKEKQIAAYQKKLDELVEQEARKARGETLTQEQIEYNAVLTGRFDQNQGKLPFPVAGGVVIEKFGATVAGLKVPAHGIKLAAKPGAQVSSVFEGTVTRVDVQRGMNAVVIVRHGNYMTLYANLATVNVGMGDKVALGQKIGTIPAGEDTDYHYLNFQIFRVEAKGDLVHLNPELWLHR